MKYCRGRSGGDRIPRRVGAKLLIQVRFLSRLQSQREADFFVWAISF
jgi:hypothetical protein